MRILADPQKLMIVAAGAIAFGYLASMAMLFTSHQWLLDASGQPLVTDFLAPRAAGVLAKAGHAVSAYNGELQHQAEAAVVGHDFAGRLGWPYPPHYFFALAPLAYLTYVQAFLLFTVVSMGSYAATIAAITQRRETVLLALAAPWCLADMMVGQNGFLSATLIGVALLTLAQRPIICAVMLCLLTYKPQLGLLVPIALAAAGHWRVIAYVVVMLLVLTLITGAVFGFDTYAAFLKVLPLTTDTLVEHGAVGWNKLQSAYGFARWLGASSGVAWGVQGALSVGIAVAIAGLWWSRATPALKAAGLSAATVVVTPYVFLYDLPVLAVAMAFLSRDHRLNRREAGAFAFVIACFVASALLAAPLAWLGGLSLLAICGERWWRTAGFARAGA